MSELEDSGIDISLSEEKARYSPPRQAQDRKEWEAVLNIAREDGAEDREIKVGDSIHGQVRVPHLCRKIMDTPQFQRLRSIKQLGTSVYVYPGAEHSRFQHSVGVMHLAGVFMDHLMLEVPGCADQRDKICVMIGGLCHDLGHGPFSHLFEQFVQEARGVKWSHEQTSIDLLDLIMEENDLMPVFQRYGLTDIDIIFIKELIFGPLNGDPVSAEQPWPYKGRDESKAFLYEIVANKMSSIDVDKMDYLLRDDHALQIGITFKYKRYIDNATLTDVSGRKRISIPDKLADNVQMLFEDRARLHKSGYQHKTVKIIDRMLLEALVASDQGYVIHNSRGERIRLSEACDDVRTFARLTDDLLFKTIQYSTSDELKISRNILDRIERRHLYKTVGSIVYHGRGNEIPMEEMKKKLSQVLSDGGHNLELEEDILFLRRNVDTGSDVDNPGQHVVFKDGSMVSRHLLSESLSKIYNCVHFFVVKEVYNFEEATEIFEKLESSFGENINATFKLSCK